ncbi:MAG: APC family permease [Syntrophomonas sp.]
MFRQLIRAIFGKSLETTRLSQEKFNVFWGLPILASDAISSVAYATEEMLWILVPVIGVGSYLWLPQLTAAIILLLLILTFSYRHVVEAYPGGGGAYMVAKENLGPLYGLIAGAALSVDYTLTVAVSICAGTAAITSAVPGIFPYRVIIAVLMIILVVIGNVRGIRESARIFSLPTYAFVITLVILIVTGIIKYYTGNFTPVPKASISHVAFGTQAVTLFLLLKAFSSGCSAVTGVEAISNAVPNFREPAARNAKLSYLLLAAAIIITFGGVAYLVNLYSAVPTPKLTVIAQLSIDIFGQGFMFYFIQIVTAMILALAANTAFAGFPTLLSVIAQDGYAPRQMAMRGHRLNFNNGIAILAILAILLVVIFKADTHLLIALYAVGVFTSFTLSQTGMLVHWFRLKDKDWKGKALVNGLGALTTLTAVIIIGITKFTEGAWIVVVIVPIIVWIMFRIKEHYNSVARQLDVPNETLTTLDLKSHFAHHVIVPIDSLNALVIKALRYASSITDNVEAFHVEPMDGEADKLKRKWSMIDTDIPLVIKHSPYREVVGPLIKYIDSEEHASKPGDIITVLLPQFFVSKWWEAGLHNNTSLFIANAMLNKHNVVVSILPLYLERKTNNKMNVYTDKEQ